MTKRRNMFPITQIWICIERHFKSNVKRSKQQRVPSLSSSGQKYFVSTCSVVHYYYHINHVNFGSVCSFYKQCLPELYIASFLPHLPPTPSTCFSFSNDISVWLVPVFFTWGSWLGYRVVQVMGTLFNLGTGYKKKKPLDSPGIQLPSSNMVVKGLLMLLF